MKRVTQSTRNALRAQRDAAWAGYTAAAAKCAKHAADRAAGRPVSGTAAADMSVQDTYARMYARADRFAARCGA